MLDGMHSVDGVLDPVTGAAFRTALDSLAVWRGPEDTRNHGRGWPTPWPSCSTTT